MYLSWLNIVPACGNFANNVKFTSSTTWVVPSTISTIWVYGTAGGSGGFSTYTGYGVGGGGGGAGGGVYYAKLTVHPGETLTVTIGSAGSAGNGGGYGGNGGNTILSGSVSGTLLTLYGGGTAYCYYGGTGGGVSAGSISIPTTNYQTYNAGISTSTTSSSLNYVAGASGGAYEYAGGSCLWNAGGAPGCTNSTYCGGGGGASLFGPGGAGGVYDNYGSNSPSYGAGGGGSGYYGYSSGAGGAGYLQISY